MPKFYFNLPNFEVLTEAQRQAVSDPGAIALSGGPGTGKSVVSLWRHIINHSKNKPTKSQLLTYTTTLAYYLKACCETKNSSAAEFVDSSLNWVNNLATQRPEIIVDEAQDLPIEFNRRLRHYSKQISYGADDQQILRSSARNANGSFNLGVCSPEASLQGEFGNELHRLTRNFRSTQKIMLFAKQYFENAFIPQEIINGLSSRIGTNPRLLVSYGNIQKQNQAIINIVRQFSSSADINTAVLLPFENYADATYNVSYYFNLLSREFDCSMYTSEMIRCDDIKNIHITTFKSAKGLEFDVVIIPNFQAANQTFRVVDWHDYYVGVTRAKSNLFLVSTADIPVSNIYVDKVQL